MTETNTDAARLQKLTGHEGGCQCGVIRYELRAAPLALYTCHCLDCQKQSSSAFGMSLWVERAAIDFRGAPPRFYRTKGDTGRTKDCAFCPECGTRIYHVTDGAGVISVKAGTLDDTSGLEPSCHIWMKRAQPWVARALEGAVCLHHQPDDLPATVMASAPAVASE